MTTSALMMVLRSPMVETGQRIATRRKELGLSQKEVTERYNTAGSTTFKGQGWGYKGDTTWLSKVERGRASGLEPIELKVLAPVLEWPEEFIAGPKELEKGITWDPFSDEEYARNVFELMRLYGQQAQELLGWGSFLPCSLEHEGFMHAHHEAFFKELPERFRIAAVRQYDEIGNKRRKFVIDGAAARPYIFQP